MSQLVVFLHAFPLDGRMWQAQVQAMPGGWAAWCPDFRGFGDAPAEPGAGAGDEAASLDDYASDVLRTLDGMGVVRAVFCGCSMGGYVAMALLRLAPDRVAGLVLADTRMTADTAQGRASRLAMVDLVDREGAAAVVSQMLPRLVGPTTLAGRPDVSGTVARLAARATARGIRQAVIRMLNRPDSTADLAAYGGPVLVVAGAEDELTPVAEAEAMAASAPAATLVVIPRAGHLANIESPDVFNAALHDFLASRVPAAAGPSVPAP